MIAQQLHVLLTLLHSDINITFFNRGRQLFYTARRRNQLRRCCRPIVLYFSPHCDTELRRTVESDFRQPPREKRSCLCIPRSQEKLHGKQEPPGDLSCECA